MCKCIKWVSIIFISIMVIAEIIESISLISDPVIRAAYIQAAGTIIAGILALFAGYLAYGAATRETRRHEEEKRDKRVAYRLYIRGSIKYFIDKLQRDIDTKANELEISIYQGMLNLYKNVFIDNWEDNSLLGKNFLEKASLIILKLTEMNAISTKIKLTKRNLTEDDVNSLFMPKKDAEELLKFFKEAEEILNKDLS